MTLHLKAETEDAGTRLDAFVASRANGLTRSQAARYIDEGRVAVDGKPASKSCRISGGETVTVMTLKDTAVMDSLLPDLSPTARQLDVNVLHTLVLERLLGIDKENMANQVNLTYTRSLREALDDVAAGAYQCSFLLNPTRVSEIRDVAAAGEKMPQKSTYFYPKLITGLTMNKLD